MPWESWTAGQCSAAAEWHQGVKEARLLGEAGLLTIELRPNQGVKTLAKAPRGWNDMAGFVPPPPAETPPRGRGPPQGHRAGSPLHPHAPPKKRTPRTSSKLWPPR